MINPIDLKLIFITGKGGVGKSSISAALGYLAAQHHRRTLVCEVFNRGDLANSYEVASTPFSGVKINSNLFAMSMDTEASLREYLSLQLKMPMVARLGPLAKAFDFVATAAPGVKEILTVGKLCYEVKERHYDCVIVDASPTGHIVGQLAAPQGINELVKVGPVKSQTAWMQDILSNPEKTGVVIVTTPEEMPVNETIELIDQIETKTTVNINSIIVNQVYPEPFNEEEEIIFQKLIRNKNVVADLLGWDPTSVFSAAKLASDVRRLVAAHIKELQRSVEDKYPIIYLPFQFSKHSGMRFVKELAQSLEEEIL